jgi:hypothetical protein
MIFLQKPRADSAGEKTGLRSKSHNTQKDYRFDSKIFTELRKAQSVVHCGLNSIPPCYCYLSVTTRHTHSNLNSKAVAVRKLEGAATIFLLSAPKCSSSHPHCSALAANSQNTFRIKSGGMGERLKPAVLKNKIADSLSRRKLS